MFVWSYKCCSVENNESPRGNGDGGAGDAGGHGGATILLGNDRIEQGSGADAPELHRGVGDDRHGRRHRRGAKRRVPVRSADVSRVRAGSGDVRGAAARERGGGYGEIRAEGASEGG